MASCGRPSPLGDAYEVPYCQLQIFNRKGPRRQAGGASREEPPRRGSTRAHPNLDPVRPPSGFKIARHRGPREGGETSAWQLVKQGAVTDEVNVTQAGLVSVP